MGWLTVKILIVPAIVDLAKHLIVAQPPSNGYAPTLQLALAETDVVLLDVIQLTIVIVRGVLMIVLAQPLIVRLDLFRLLATDALRQMALLPKVAI